VKSSQLMYVHACELVMWTSSPRYLVSLHRSRVKPGTDS
jgi:hypothetical protein